MSAIQKIYNKLETTFKDEADFRSIVSLTTHVNFIKIKFYFGDSTAKEKTTKFPHSYSLIPQNDSDSKLKFFVDYFSKASKGPSCPDFGTCVHELKSLLAYSPQCEQIKANQKKVEKHLLAASECSSIDDLIRKIDLFVQKPVPSLGDDAAWSKGLEKLLRSVVLTQKGSLPTIFHEQIFRIVQDGLLKFLEEDWKDNQKNIIFNTLLKTHTMMDVKDKEIMSVIITVDYTDSDKKNSSSRFQVKKTSKSGSAPNIA